MHVCTCVNACVCVSVCVHMCVCVLCACVCMCVCAVVKSALKAALPTSRIRQQRWCIHDPTPKSPNGDEILWPDFSTYIRSLSPDEWTRFQHKVWTQNNLKRGGPCLHWETPDKWIKFAHNLNGLFFRNGTFTACNSIGKPFGLPLLKYTMRILKKFPCLNLTLPDPASVDHLRGWIEVQSCTLYSKKCHSTTPLQQESSTSTSCTSPFNKVLYNLATWYLSSPDPHCILHSSTCENETLVHVLNRCNFQTGLYIARHDRLVDLISDSIIEVQEVTTKMYKHSAVQMDWLNA